MYRSRNRQSNRNRNNRLPLRVSMDGTEEVPAKHIPYLTVRAMASSNNRVMANSNKATANRRITVSNSKTTASNMASNRKTTASIMTTISRAANA